MKNLAQILLLTTVLAFTVVDLSFGLSSLRKEEIRQCKNEFIDYNDAVTFAKLVKNAVLNNDKNKLAEMASYPLKVGKVRENSSDKKVIQYIKTKRQFIEQYSLIFSKEVINSILQNDISDIFCKYQSGSIADGSMWFHGNPLKFYIVLK
ncbi:MAG: hypothetical protein M1561_00925 [Gammaproteobacteria bacterium]|nr:hypothetical protein [Gammaproteobacteria bacterium]